MAPGASGNRTRGFPDGQAGCILTCMPGESPHARTVDLSGLPEPVVDDIKRLVQTLRERMPAQEGTNGQAPTRASEQRKPLIGRLAHLGLKTPSLDEFKEARREAWANFPRDFPGMRSG
jgi:hypothetical protein